MPRRWRSTRRTWCASWPVSPGEAERTPLGVLADRPRLPGMDDAAAERLDPLERLREIVDGEVGQGERVSGAAPPFVDADRRDGRTRLPAGSLPLASRLQRNAQQAAPEASRALGVVGRELDQRQRFASRLASCRAPGEQRQHLLAVAFDEGRADALDRRQLVERATASARRSTPACCCARPCRRACRRWRACAIPSARPAAARRPGRRAPRSPSPCGVPERSATPGRAGRSCAGSHTSQHRPIGRARRASRRSGRAARGAGTSPDAETNASTAR